jgi:hypothetical protein
VSRDDEQRYIEAVSFYGPEDRDALLAPGMRAGGRHRPSGRCRARFEALAHLPLGSRMMRVDFGTYLPEDVLTKVDRMSMAHSIESRVPLLDHPLVEFASAAAARTEDPDGERKRLLRRVAARVLPPAILAKRKQGFGVPLGTWFRGQLRDAFEDVLRSPRLRQRGYFDGREIDRLLAEHRSGKRDHELRLWQLFMFELWHRQYVDRGATAARPAETARQRSAGAPRSEAGNDSARGRGRARRSRVHGTASLTASTTVATAGSRSHRRRASTRLSRRTVNSPGQPWRTSTSTSRACRIASATRAACASNDGHTGQ